MNSLTHSCIHSLASLAILALSGRAFFMMRATGAKFRILASSSSALSAFEARGALGDLEDELQDMRRVQICTAERAEAANSSRKKERTNHIGMPLEIDDLPLAIGSQRSCSFTPSNSYPAAFADCGSCCSFICASSSGDGAPWSTSL